MKFAMKVAAVIAAAATAIAIPATAANAAAVKRTSPKAATVQAEDVKVRGTVKEFLVIQPGGLAFRSVYMEDDTGNQYWNRFGAVEGLDGRPVDAYYDYDNDRYYANMKKAYEILTDNEEGIHTELYVQPRMGDWPSRTEIADLVAAFKASGKSYMSVDGKAWVVTQAFSESPIMYDFERITDEYAGAGDGIQYDTKCREVGTETVCDTVFTGQVRANGTKEATFRFWYGVDGALLTAMIIDGRGRVIARDVVKYNTADTITVPVADSVFYRDLIS